MESIRIKIMVADDMEAHRRRLEREIAKQPDMELLKSAANGYEAVLCAGLNRPDIILMDIEMEDKYAGVLAAKEINHNLPDTKIIILTVHEDDNIVFAAFQTGIVDYLTKTAELSEIMEAVRSAYHNLSPIRPIIAQKIRNEFKKIKEREENLLSVLKLISNLTPSELKVLQLLCEGKSNRQLADIRCVEHSTIKKQVNSILKKCEHQTTRELVRTIQDLKIFEVLKTLIS